MLHLEELHGWREESPDVAAAMQKPVPRPVEHQPQSWPLTRHDWQSNKMLQLNNGSQMVPNHLVRHSHCGGPLSLGMHWPPLQDSLHGTAFATPRWTSCCWSRSLIARNVRRGIEQKGP